MQTLRARVDGRRLNTIIKLPEAFQNRTLDIDVYLDEGTQKAAKNDSSSFALSSEIAIDDQINLNADNDLTLKRRPLKERLAMLDSLIGIVPPDADEKRVKDERLARQ
jgi:hypothetical protein